MSRTAYIAHRPLSYTHNGKRMNVAPGEEVVGFEEWDNEPKHAHLSQEIVTLETVEDKAPPKPKPATAKKTKTTKKKQ